MHHDMIDDIQWERLTVQFIASMTLSACLMFAAEATAAPNDLPEGASMARLETPLVRPLERLVDGRDWSCAGAVCVAGRQDMADSQPLWMECSHAAAEFGAFTQYRTGSDTLGSAKLNQCNAHAKQAPRG